MWKKEIAQLKQIKDESKYTSVISQIARELGVHRSTVHRWAKGQQLPRRKRKRQIREILKKHLTK